MVTVDQNMTITPTSIEREQPAFIFGPNYELHRYEKAEEKAKTFIGQYACKELKAEYPGVIDDEMVDKSYTKLYGDNVTVQLADLTGPSSLSDPRSVVKVTFLERDTTEEDVASGLATTEQNNYGLRSKNGGYTRMVLDAKYVNRNEKGVRQELERVEKSLVVGDSLYITYNEQGSDTETSILTTIAEVSYNGDQGYDLDDVAEDVESGLEAVKGTFVAINEAIPETADLSSVQIKLVEVFNGVEFEKKNYQKMSGYQWEADEIVIYDYNELSAFGAPSAVTFDKKKIKVVDKAEGKIKTDGNGLPVFKEEEVDSDTFSSVTYNDADYSDKLTAGKSLLRLSWRIGNRFYERVVKVADVTRSNNATTIKFDSPVIKDAASTLAISVVEQLAADEVNGIKVNELNVRTTYNQKYCDVLSADLYVTYRELLTQYADTFHSVLASSEVSNLLGTIDPDNPLAMGVYMAALNSATDDGDETPPIYFMAVPTDNLEGYNQVLNQATNTDKAYVFAPTTRDDAVLEAVRSHVLEMSGKTVKMWRIAAGSAEIPETVDRLNSLMDVQGDDYLAIPISKTKGDKLDQLDYNILRVVKSLTDRDGSADTKFRSTLVKGDTVRFGFYTNAWGEETYDEYKVTKVINNYTVEVEAKNGCVELENLYMDQEKVLQAGSNVQDFDENGNLLFRPTAYTPSKIEIFHTYTSAESADVIASVSKAFATRRMLNVFPSVFSNDGVKMTGEFAACAVAGLISATEPQQPITNMTVRGIDNIPLTYQTYNKAELDTIAAGGTFIVAQDLPSDKVYVRHQITTAYPDGNLNTAELSITKNVDSISYAFAELFRPYYGKYNITEHLLVTFHALASSLISHLGSGSSVYGPQLIADETEIKYIRQNELMKDHVDIAITLGVPYPCNNIDIVLTV